MTATSKYISQGWRRSPLIVLLQLLLLLLAQRISATETPTVAPTDAPTAAPTAAPTEAPTEAPTVERHIVLQFAVSQVIYGVTKSQYDSSSRNYGSTVQHSVADTMDGISYNDVTVVTVNDQSNSVTRRTLTDSRKSNWFSFSMAKDLVTEAVSGMAFWATTQALAKQPLDAANCTHKSSSIQINYDVSTSNSSLTYAVLSQQLSTAVSDNSFTSALNNYAITYNAVGLESPACSNKVQTVEIGGASSSDGDLSTGQVVGIVFAVLMAVGILIYLFFARQRKRSSNIGKEYEAVRLTGADDYL